MYIDTRNCFSSGCFMICWYLVAISVTFIGIIASFILYLFRPVVYLFYDIARVLRKQPSLLLQRLRSWWECLVNKVLRKTRLTKLKVITITVLLEKEKFTHTHTHTFNNEQFCLSIDIDTHHLMNEYIYEYIQN